MNTEITINRIDLTQLLLAESNEFEESILNLSKYIYDEIRSDVPSTAGIQIAADELAVAVKHHTLAMLSLA